MAASTSAAPRPRREYPLPDAMVRLHRWLGHRQYCSTYRTATRSGPCHLLLDPSPSLTNDPLLRALSPAQLAPNEGRYAVHQRTGVRYPIGHRSSPEEMEG